MPIIWLTMKRLYQSAAGFIQELILEMAAHWRMYPRSSDLSGGFIPMLLMLLALIVAIIVLVYMRVAKAHV